ncbi:9448_t:CDS:2, partial [Gigaspora rosea]
LHSQTQSNVRSTDAINSDDSDSSVNIANSEKPILLIQALKFLGAFSEPFEAKFRVNIYIADKIKAWLKEFSDLHKTM